jgi:hypothetical protein
MVLSVPYSLADSDVFDKNLLTSLFSCNVTDASEFAVEDESVGPASVNSSVVTCSLSASATSLVASTNGSLVAAEYEENEHDFIWAGVMGSPLFEIVHTPVDVPNTIPIIEIPTIKMKEIGIKSGKRERDISVTGRFPKRSSYATLF